MTTFQQAARRSPLLPARAWTPIAAALASGVLVGVLVHLGSDERVLKERQVGLAAQAALIAEMMSMASYPWSADPDRPRNVAQAVLRTLPFRADEHVSVFDPAGRLLADNWTAGDHIRQEPLSSAKPHAVRSPHGMSDIRHIDSAARLRRNIETAGQTGRVIFGREKADRGTSVTVAAPALLGHRVIAVIALER